VSGGGSGYSNGGGGGYINMPLISTFCFFVLFYSLSEHKRWQLSRGMPPPSHFIIVLYYVFIPNSNKILLVIFMNI
jgi:hypothetical protein